MKKLTLILLTICFSITGFAQKSFTLSGKITGQPNTYVNLSYVNNEGKRVSDSCLLNNDSFLFKGTISEPTRGFLSIKKNTATIFLEEGNITATGRYDALNDLTVTGSKTQNEYTSLQVKLNQIENKFTPILKQIDEANRQYTQAKKNNLSAKAIDSLNEKLDAIRKLREPLAGEYEAAVYSFVKGHPDSFISPMQMIVYTGSWPLDTVKMLYNSFTDAVKNGSGGKRIKKTIDDREKVISEITAKNFTATDVKGKSLNLANFKAQYVLLDFWGSWCIPCREGNPHLIQLFNKYHKNGFDVIGVAIQEPSREDWEKAINKDKIGIWHHIRGDVNGLSVQKLYGVNIYPTKILIDKTGTIIGRYDGSESTEALDKKLAEIFEDKK